MNRLKTIMRLVLFLLQSVQRNIYLEWLPLRQVLLPRDTMTGHHSMLVVMLVLPAVEWELPEIEFILVRGRAISRQLRMREGVVRPGRCIRFSREGNILSVTIGRMEHRSPERNEEM